jgi:hypothetical protein
VKVSNATSKATTGIKRGVIAARLIQKRTKFVSGRAVHSLYCRQGKSSGRQFVEKLRICHAERSEVPALRGSLKEIMGFQVPKIVSEMAMLFPTMLDDRG